MADWFGVRRKYMSQVVVQQITLNFDLCPSDMPGSRYSYSPSVFPLVLLLLLHLCWGWRGWDEGRGGGGGGLAGGEKGYKIGSHVLRVSLRLFLSEAIKAGCYGYGAPKADEMERGGRGGGGGDYQGDIIDLFN